MFSFLHRATPARQTARPKPASWKLCLEGCEERVLLSAFTPVPLGAAATRSYSTINPDFPTGDVTLSGVPFVIPAKGNNVVWDNVPDGPATGTIVKDFPANVAGATQVHTLINTAYGQAGPHSYLSLEFFGSAGADYTVRLVGNADIRDFNPWVWTNGVNGTSTVNVYKDARGRRIDMQTFVLPAAFADQTLTDIRMIDSGAYQFQRAILYGITVSTVPAGTLTAYRPDTPNVAFQNYPIPAAEAASRGVGIRIDGEDNSHGATQTGRPDHDLIEVAVNVSAPAPTGFHYALQASNPSIEVWGDQSKETPLLGSGTTSLPLSSPPTVVWVEWAGPKQGVGSLSLLVVDEASGKAATAAKLSFHTFSSDVIVFTGETDFDGSNSELGPMLAVSTYLYTHGYDTHLFAPNQSPGRTVFGNGAAYAEVGDAVLDRGVTHVSIVGYSHGGGAAYDLASVMAKNRLLPAGVSVPFTAYIDAVGDATLFDRSPELYLPPGTLYHLNVFETASKYHGAPVRGASNVNETSAGLGHASIAQSPLVQSMVEDMLTSRLPR